jgi:N-acylneuraminate cytidylyltransferase
MIQNKTVVAVIPVRAGSRRLPNKNILPFGDTNLLVHKIRQLKMVPAIDHVVVSSDSDIMLSMAQNEGVLTHKRAPEYCDEKTKTFNEVVRNVAENVSDDILMWAPCVCPLTTVDSYTLALKIFGEKVLKAKEYDSVISGKKFKEYLFDEQGPVNWNPEHHVPSQQLPEWKTIINGFYIASRSDMIKWSYLYGKNPYVYILDKKEAVDIDDAEDFAIAKALLGMEKTK